MMARQRRKFWDLERKNHLDWLQSTQYLDKIILILVIAMNKIGMAWWPRVLEILEILEKPKMSLNVLESPGIYLNLPKCPWIVLEFHLAVISKNVVSKFHLTFKFHNFLQPWRRNGIYFGDKWSHSGLFQMVKYKNFLQQCWRNIILYFGDK